MTEKKTICDRCGQDIEERFSPAGRYAQLFRNVVTNEVGEDVELDLCWDCDWDVMNGGDPFEDSTDIHYRRWEEAYAYDPVNTDPPPGYQ